MDLGFRFRATAKGIVQISRGGREVAVLRGEAARAFIARVQGASAQTVQQLCARVTGNYKRGNESAALRKRRQKDGYT